MSFENTQTRYDQSSENQSRQSFTTPNFMHESYQSISKLNDQGGGNNGSVVKDGQIDFGSPSALYGDHGDHMGHGGGHHHGHGGHHHGDHGVNSSGNSDTTVPSATSDAQGGSSTPSDTTSPTTTNSTGSDSGVTTATGTDAGTTTAAAATGSDSGTAATAGSDSGSTTGTATGSDSGSAAATGTDGTPNSTSSSSGSGDGTQSNVRQDLQNAIAALDKGDLQGEIQALMQALSDLSASGATGGSGGDSAGGDVGSGDSCSGGTAQPNDTGSCSQPTDSGASAQTTDSGSSNSQPTDSGTTTQTGDSGSSTSQPSDSGTTAQTGDSGSSTTQPSDSGTTTQTGDSGSSTGSANQSGVDGDAPISVDSIIQQQDASKNPVLPGGGILNYGVGWRVGASGQWPTQGMPADANSVTDWMTAYPIDGSAVTPGSSVTVKDLNEYALENGKWYKMSTTDDGQNWGQTNPNSMIGIVDNTIPTTLNSDGSFTLAASGDGVVNQWGGPTGSFDPSKIEGIYVSAQVKANSNDSNTAVDLGADWYNGSSYIEGVGTSNWMPLTDQYQSISFTNLDADTLKNNPPPGAST